MLKKLWELTKARISDPITSKLAAQQAKKVAESHYQVILKALRAHGPMGKDGIAEVTGLDGAQIARRLGEMHRGGVVVLTGRHVKSKAGRDEREWKILSW